jgi:hypothetical protein
MDLLGASKEKIEQIFKFPTVLPPLFGDATNGDQFNVGNYVLLFGYKPVDGILKVIYVLKRQGDMQAQTLTDAEILPQLYTCRSTGIWSVVPLDPAPPPPPPINPPAPPMRDRTYQHVIPGADKIVLPSGAFAKEGRIRQRLICYTADWFGDPDTAMLKWN